MTQQEMEGFIAEFGRINQEILNAQDTTVQLSIFTIRIPVFFKKIYQTGYNKGFEAGRVSEQIKQN